MVEWIKDETFNAWMKEREKEKSTSFSYGETWSPKEWGTADEPKVYEGRFLPDPKGVFYKKYLYHMFMSSSEEWQVVFCPKNDDFKNFCPVCFTASKLYAGSENDKKLANKYKRKIRYVGNFYVVSDPRDNKENTEDTSWAGKVWPYEFPGKIEDKLDEELKDPKGLGKFIFDPGENGHNFVIKVKTQKDFPEYGSSAFARRPSALGTDKEIRKILEGCVDIVEWLENKKRSNNWNAVKEVLEEESLYTDSLAREWGKHWGLSEDTKEKYNSSIGVPPDDPTVGELDTAGELETPLTTSEREDFLKQLDEF